MLSLGGTCQEPSERKYLVAAPAAGAGTSPCLPAAEAVAPVIATAASAAAFAFVIALSAVDFAASALELADSAVVVAVAAFVFAVLASEAADDAVEAAESAAVFAALAIALAELALAKAVEAALPTEAIFDLIGACLGQNTIDFPAILSLPIEGCLEIFRIGWIDRVGHVKPLFVPGVS